MNQRWPRWRILYGERQDMGAAYVVSDGVVRYKFEFKSAAIADAQYRNGWPVDGREQTFAEQAELADKRHPAKLSPEQFEGAVYIGVFRDPQRQQQNIPVRLYDGAHYDLLGQRVDVQKMVRVV